MNVTLVETMKRNLTKQVNIEVHPQHINEEVIKFVEKNLKNFPGRSTLKFTLSEPAKNWKISMVTMENGFEMNDELIEFLDTRPELDVQVQTF
jgi:DNA polymerase-3 subunit alpha